MPARKHLLLLVSLSIVGSMLLLLLNLPFPVGRPTLTRQRSLLLIAAPAQRTFQSGSRSTEWNSDSVLRLSMLHSSPFQIRPTGRKWPRLWTDLAATGKYPSRRSLSLIPI